MKNNLKKIRKEQGLTQEELAKKAGISRVALAMIEIEKNCPDGNTIAALVRALGVSANKIFFDFDVV